MKLFKACIVNAILGCILIISYPQIALATTFTTTTSIEMIKSDYLVVVMNNQLIFDAFQTETSVSDISILKTPDLGELVLNDDQTFTYIPADGVCRQKDFFTYLLRTETGEEMIEVNVDIICESLLIPSGFSPNGDGKDDQFKILGIQNFPNNTLTIFDSEGSEVLYVQNYQNDWNGVIEGETIPTDSMYYYVFYDGKENYHSGYLKIQ